MKTFFYILCFSIFLSCNTDNSKQASSSQNTHSEKDEMLNSVKGENGKYIVDHVTAEYLHRLENTVTNFKLIAKKRKPAVDIYNEFSEILKRELGYLSANTNITGEGNDHLKIIVEKITAQNIAIAGNDLEQAKTAFQQVCNLTDGINLEFDYNN